MAKHHPEDCTISKSDSSDCRFITAPLSTEKEVDDPTDVSGRYSITRKKADRDNNNLALPFCPESKLPSFIEHDRLVLLFNAYYEEDVHQSLEEEKILHACEVYFYVEDGTMEIIQTKTENSGIVQGKFLRRSKVVKPGTSLHYGIDDLKIGNTLDIYSRSFRVVNCNESTRRYVLEHHGWSFHDVQPIALPRDHFAEMNRAKMMRESGVPGVDRKRKMNDLKVVMESQLGKQSSMTDRGMFLEHGTDALCFHVTWDDRSRLYGNIQYFRLIYHLADDTIEIVRASNTTRDGTATFPKLLKRSKLPKSGQAFDNSDCYSWKDLAIGQLINVFGRMMLIVKCDQFTRAHYQSHGIELKEDLPLVVEEKKVEIRRIVPPPNGFGSEEDSLRSCTGSINPPPLKKDLSSNKKSGIVLHFNASLVVDDDADDSIRKFAIHFFLEDDTISIQEPPIRNSGYVGGQFLRRQPINHISASDMYVGNMVEVVGHQFLLRDADESTFKLMECDEKTFPYSDTARLQRILSTKQDMIRAYFVSHYDGNGNLDLEGLSKCCSAIGIVINHAELITIWRRIKRNNSSGLVPFNKLLKFATEETSFASK
eukprot:scaffold6334_cov139-Skeletonema_menzelii.AAC.4